MGFALAACEEIVDPAEQTYTVTYSGNTHTGGTAPVDSNSPYQGTSRVTVLGNTGNLVKTGYTFTNWNTLAGGGGTPYNPGDGFDIIANVTLYAQWAESPKFTLAYNANSGSGSAPVDSNSPYFSGTLVTVMQKGDLNRSGYYFTGWNTLANGSGTSYAEGATFNIAANTTLYAQWANNHTVSYNGNGQTSANSTVPTDSATYAKGASVTTKEKGTLVKRGYDFTNWNTKQDGTGSTIAAGADFTITENITLYAQWQLATMPTGDLATKLQWLTNNALQGTEYLVEVSKDEAIGPYAFNYPNNNTNVKITLRGTGSARDISLNAGGNLFTVASGVTLILDGNITLIGRGDNYGNSLILVSSGGTLIMNTGNVIKNNANGSNDSGMGSAVQVQGTFTMNGGTITNCTGNYGGGVYVRYTGSTFTMNGGTIEKCTANAFIGGKGGGVYVDTSANFNFNDGTIKENKVAGTAGAYGGGVWTNGTTNMAGGTITENEGGQGGGVFVNPDGTFKMTGGVISKNTATRGGGVFTDGGTINKTAGIIYGLDGGGQLDANGNKATNTLTNPAGPHGHAAVGGNSSVSPNTIIKNNTSGADHTLYIQGRNFGQGWDATN